MSMVYRVHHKLRAKDKTCDVTTDWDLALHLAMCRVLAQEEASRAFIVADDGKEWDVTFQFRGQTVSFETLSALGIQLHEGPGVVIHAVEPGGRVVQSRRDPTDQIECSILSGKLMAQSPPGTRVFAHGTRSGMLPMEFKVRAAIRELRWLGKVVRRFLVGD